MKEKIRLALVNKYKNLGFSDKAIEGILAYLESTVTAEDQIEGAVNAVEPMLKAFQTEVDSRVGTAVAKVKAPEQPKPEEPAKAQEPVATPAEAPDWAKTWMQTITTKVDTVVNDVTAIKTGKATDTRKTQLDEVLKDAPEAYKNAILTAFPLMKFEKDEDFTAYLDGLKTSSAAFVQETATAGLSQVRRPVVPAGETSKQATKAELDAVMPNLSI